MAKWFMMENPGGFKSKVEFEWYPRTKRGPQLKIITNEKSHNLIRVRSKTKDSVIAVTSASSPMTTESWSFSFNFRLEAMIATRVQSNSVGIKGQVLNYQCTYQSLQPTLFPDDANRPIG